MKSKGGLGDTKMIMSDCWLLEYCDLQFNLFTLRFFDRGSLDFKFLSGTLKWQRKEHITMINIIIIISATVCR